MNRSRLPRRWVVRAVAAALVVALLAPAAGTALSGGAAEPGELSPGTVERTPNGSTVVSIQGFHFQGTGSSKKPARLVAANGTAETQWLFGGGAVDARWFYDVDPLPNGNLLVSSTNPEGTVVFELDRQTREPVWTERLDMTDTHDVDRLNDTHLVVANMRNYDEESGVSNDRIVVYDRVEGEIEREWLFRDHYPNSTDGGFNEDWSHVNDVDVIDDHRVLLSPRNFDQAVVLNLTTGTIEQRLGADDEYDMLNEQHNPDYLRSDAGNPTILVADSENDRVVEYAKVDGEWRQTWVVGEGQLNWPRDADRLPNGNTLIVDSLNHRVIEVTPDGKVVWEYYATWGPYDAERIGTGDGSSQDGPTIRDMGAQGEYALRGSAGLLEGTSSPFADWMARTTAGTPLAGLGETVAARWAHVTPWIRPVWMTGWDFAYAVGAALVGLGWGLGEGIYQRRRLLAVARAFVGRGQTLIGGGS
ncbi:MAG: aryl-sulfate sulfotransferase [Halolamina sp.]